MAGFFFGFAVIIGTRIGNIPIDCSPEQTHRFPSRITENPVEDGSVYADHVTLLPATVEIVGRISNASLLSTFSGRTFQDAYHELVRLQARRQPFDVVTGLHVYRNMLLEDLVVPRQAQDGQSMRFHAVLKEVLIVGRDVQTNRENIDASVRHTGLPYSNNGLVQTFPLAEVADIVGEAI